MLVSVRIVAGGGVGTLEALLLEGVVFAGRLFGTMVLCFEGGAGGGVEDEGKMEGLLTWVLLLLLSFSPSLFRAALSALSSLSGLHNSDGWCCEAL